MKELRDEYYAWINEDDTIKTEDVVAWWLTKIEEIRKKDRQFILNILDGVDIANRNMGIVRGTETIRFALAARILSEPIIKQNETTNM